MPVVNRYFTVVPAHLQTFVYDLQKATSEIISKICQDLSIFRK